MNEEIKKIVELEIDLDNLELEEMGVQVVSFVEEPAIEVDFMAFNSEEFDYDPSSLTPYRDQDDELKPKQNFSERDIEMVDGIIDILSQVEDLDNRMAMAHDAIRDLAAQGVDFDTKDFMNRIGFGEYEFSDDELTEEQKIILLWAQEHGEQINEDWTYLDPSKEEFNTIEDISKAITGLDILGKMGIRQDEPAQIRYRYTGPTGGNSRSFCRAMMSLNKVYADGDMRSLRGRLGSINPGMGPGENNNSYNVFAYKGGVNCRHFWSKVALYKPEGSRRVLMIEEGPAEGDAGKSNNSRTPSPTGSVRNNASLRFSFAIQDEAKRIVAGPLMTPNKMILRRDGKGEPYYVFFSKDTIRRIQERFNRAGFQNVTDIDHDGQIKTDNILLEQWLVESRVHDKSRFYGFMDLPIGTWFGVYKVNNDQTWEDIKAGKIRGFSIAGDFINKSQPVATDETVLDKIINVLKDIK